MTDEPDSLILRMLREMRAEIGDLRSEMATKADLSELGSDLRPEIASLRADVASDLHNFDAKIDKNRKEVGDQIVGLRRAVVEYHTSVIGARYHYQ